MIMQHVAANDIVKAVKPRRSNHSEAADCPIIADVYLPTVSRCFCPVKLDVVMPRPPPLVVVTFDRVVPEEVPGSVRRLTG